MSKKMCQHWMKKRRNFYGGHCDLKHNDCPKNTNSRCEIITKPKPRMVRVRGRVFFPKSPHSPLCIDTCNLETTDALERAYKKYGDFRVTLIVDRKYITTRMEAK